MPHPPAEHLAITSPDLSAFLPTNMSKSVVQHIVLLKVKQGVPLSQINDMIHAIRGMQGRIPGLLDVTAGANFMMERYAVSLVAPTQLLLAVPKPHLFYSCMQEQGLHSRSARRAGG